MLNKYKAKDIIKFYLLSIKPDSQKHAVVLTWRDISHAIIWNKYFTFNDRKQFLF